MFTISRLGLAFCLMSVMVSSVWSESLPSELSLQSAFDTAFEQNPQVLSIRARLGVSEAEIRTAAARLNPRLVSDNGIAEKTYRLGIEQTVELGGKRKQRVALAQATRQVVASEINSLLLDIRASVRRAYTQLYNAQQRQQTLQEIADVTQTLLTVAQLREKAGDIARLDVLQAMVAVVTAKNDLQTALYQVVQARSTLNNLLNQPLSAQVVLAAPPSAPVWATSTGQPNTQASQTGPVLQAGIGWTAGDLDQLIQSALAHRPEVLQNRQGLHVTEQQEALAKANRIPNVALTGGYDRVIGTEGANNVFLIGNLELPVLNRQQGPIQEAQARRRQLGLERTALNRRIALEVTNAYTQFIASEERVGRYEAELLPMAQEVMSKARRSFEVGKTPVLISITAQQGFISTRLGYQAALLDLQNALSDLERAVGVGL